MLVISTHAKDLTEHDTIDLADPLEWLSGHTDESMVLDSPLAYSRENFAVADGIVFDEFAVARDIAAIDYATIYELERTEHSVTGEPVVIIRNSIYDLAVPATLPIPRITS
ncbi:hypothetical protein PXH69_29245 [Rhodococcus qingshengii]|uniref:UbiC transcription regulator-associated domain-containing protein n=1 Tax=Rhodococcus qingshengii TaxID=334542 RepID=A0AAW6LVT8_RHOSG|nr:hypothetical protein [Rhodococcus qingshengii]MDE8649065.1 hypothetical protein [Rhodococcus qingshengii]